MQGLAVLASADVVVHSAAAVAFDAPIDTAVEVNLLGPSRVAGAISSVADRRASEYPERSPTHLVSVSTAYVAGTHQGHATETLATDAIRSGARARTHTTVTTEVDIDSEIAAARRVRTDLEAQSRTPQRLTKFTKKARTELGAAGTHLLAERAEKLRLDWVRAGLVDAGRARAQALGWPDAYAFTKALGERVLVTEHPDVPMTVVRPSIIESALAEPRPGWIRGFRMAEPIIVSYAAGAVEGVPRRPRGGHRRRTRRLGCSSDNRVRGGRARRHRNVRGARRVGGEKPAQVRPSRRPGPDVVHRAPALRHRWTADRRAGLVVPRTWSRVNVSSHTPSSLWGSPSEYSGPCRSEESGRIWPPVSRSAALSPSVRSDTSTLRRIHRD